jgi:integrase
MRNFENFLKVSGWDSEFRSIQNLLNHLARKTKSESSRRHYLESVYTLCRKEGKTPDELVEVGKAKAERAVQSLLDDMKKQDRSIRYINVTMAHLLGFFEVNGFKRLKKIEVERYFQPTRYRKRAEYIPTDQEIRRMADNAGSPKAKACILGLYTSGVRNSTLRAILYRDVKAELDTGTYPIHIPIYVEMKKIDPDACKGSLPYSTFLSKEAAIAVKTYVEEFNRKNSPLRPEEPLFQGKVRGRPIKRRTLEVLVKDAARRAGIAQWRDVYPHVLRKAFERAVRNGGLDSKEQEFLQGHVLPGSQDTYFDKTKTEEFRTKHAKVKFFPEVATFDEMEKTVALKTNEAIVRFFGYDPKDFDWDLSKLSPETIRDKFVKGPRREPRLTEKGTEMLRKQGQEPGQRVIKSSELQGAIDEGWIVKLELKDGRLVLERPET